MFDYLQGGREGGSMFERFRNNGSADEPRTRTGSVATAERTGTVDGARQGIGAWVVGIIITILAGVLAAVAGDQYNVVSRANLPRLPIGQDTLTTGGIIATIAILLGTLLCAALGGIAGARYHRKVD